MRQLILVKLGGSLITDKSVDSIAKPEIISRLANEFKSAKKNFDGHIIIAHGSGSFGHFAAAKYHLRDGSTPPLDPMGLPEVANAAVKINRIVVDNFLRQSVPVVSFAPASLIVASAKKTKKVLLEPILLSLDYGLTPILYGDIIFDQKIGFCIFSSETTLSLLARK